MNLVIDIALTHIRSRMRQTLVGLLGVATGVGFSVMMASLMEGSQQDFIDRLVDSLPHISVSDERREPPVQPAERTYDAVRILSLSTEKERAGIKNPFAIIAALEGWLPGSVAPSVQSKAIIRYAGRDTAATVIGIDPKREVKVSQLPTQVTQGSLDALYKASNAVILGDGLASRIGARVGNTLTITTSGARPLFAQVVGLFHAGVRQIDDNQVYTLVKTAQILEQQIGLVNELRIRVDDAMAARDVASRIERQTGYKAVSWQEAHEDLLSAFQIRNAIMIMVVGAILLVASFGTFNIVSTITHEKARDIAIMKSLGLREATVRRIFVLEATIIGALGMVVGWVFGFLLCVMLGQIEFKTGFTDATRLPLLYSPWHYAIAGAAALGSSVIAGFFPARKAARVHPVEIIRGAS
ncbi:ABC transporter permease [Alsobacter sp. SYSU M60028]|uniref:ABC transporter permease n=1 Tax=Alsobacter ponti TaxID=2962936 RepID=A0ABT1LCE4_9HYPH|nr:ABC transporter permease [Alsobacter ponti]MCP8939180.1 ABC transporter permease [Alsobacter ponti]